MVFKIYHTFFLIYNLFSLHEENLSEFDFYIVLTLIYDHFKYL